METDSLIHVQSSLEVLLFVGITLYTHCTCTCTLNTVQGLSEGFYLVGSGSTGVATSLAILGIYFVVLTSFDKWNHLYRPFQILLILTVLLFVLTVLLFVLTVFWFVLTVLLFVLGGILFILTVLLFVLGGILFILTVLLFVLTVMLFVLGFYCLFKLTRQCFFYRAQS